LSCKKYLVIGDDVQVTKAVNSPRRGTACITEADRAAVAKSRIEAVRIARDNQCDGGGGEK
jgi:hypothetical protein